MRKHVCSYAGESNPAAGYPEWNLSWYFSVTPGECWDSTLKQAINTSFLIPTNSQFMKTLPIKPKALTLKPSNIIIHNKPTVLGSETTVKPQFSEHFYCEGSDHRTENGKQLHLPPPSIPNFMKTYLAVQRLLVGDRQTERPVI
jgi:hypothetical protein